ncbi:hypothetical protein HYU13_04045 [Candidatus Woesearchaeota archaeon]|nr:hypothetical protein [Candidatus Woesearchaeota archaeon]
MKISTQFEKIVNLYYLNHPKRDRCSFDLNGNPLCYQNGLIVGSKRYKILGVDSQIFPALPERDKIKFWLTIPYMEEDLEDFVKNIFSTPESSCLITYSCSSDRFREIMKKINPEHGHMNFGGFKAKVACSQSEPHIIFYEVDSRNSLFVEYHPGSGRNPLKCEYDGYFGKDPYATPITVQSSNSERERVAKQFLMTIFEQYNANFFPNKYKFFLNLPRLIERKIINIPEAIRQDPVYHFWVDEVVFPSDLFNTRELDVNIDSVALGKEVKRGLSELEELSCSLGCTIHRGSIAIEIETDFNQLGNGLVQKSLEELCP